MSACASPPGQVEHGIEHHLQQRFAEHEPEQQREAEQRVDDGRLDLMKVSSWRTSVRPPNTVTTTAETSAITGSRRVNA